MHGELARQYQRTLGDQPARDFEIGKRATALHPGRRIEPDRLCDDGSGARQALQIRHARRASSQLAIKFLVQPRCALGML